jgi:hypothetical protein
MSATVWHLDEELASRYAVGRMGPALAASTEQHLVGCASCRTLLPAEPGRLERVWDEVLERIQTPRPTVLERFLRRLGVDESSARLVAITPSLRSAWLCGVVVVLLLSILVAQQGPSGVALFVLFAPVLPVVGVAFAFGPATDPAHELAAAAPYSAVRLLAIRTLVVVATTCAPALVAGLLIPGPTWVAFAWLLPALALTALTVALATRFPPHVVAVGLVSLWASVVMPAVVRRDDPLFGVDLPLQLVSLVVVIAAATILVTRRHDLPELLRGYSR